MTDFDTTDRKGTAHRPAFPDDHPLAPYSGDLETHEDHLRAFGDVLFGADPAEVEAAMVVLTGEDGTDTLPTVKTGVDARWSSIWMLGAHIHHVAAAASEASGQRMTMQEAADHAIRAIQQHNGPREAYDGGDAR